MRSFIYILLFLVLSTTYSQERNYKFTHLSNTHGLSQSSAIAICQDQLGHLWVGTRDGLNKYDGTNFTVYRTETSNINSISNNDILCIQQDSYGYLWIGTYNGLNKYDPRTDTFTRYFHTENSTSLINNTVWNLKELHNGNLLIGTSSGFSVYQRDSNSFNNFGRKNILNRKIYSILETNNKEVFLGTNKGLYKLLNYTKGAVNLSVVNGSNHLFVQDLLLGKNNNFLIATKHSGILQYSFGSKTINSFVSKSDFKDAHINVRKLLYNESDLWVGTYNGLKVIDKNNAIKTLKSNFNDASSLTKNSIKSIFKDKKGSIWVGTYYGGLNVWDKSNVNFKNITENQNKRGLNYSVVSSIANYKDDIFFGTEGGGISVLNKKTGSYSYVNTLNCSGFKDNNIKALTLINKQLWIGSFNKGVVIYNPKTKTINNDILPKALKQYIAHAGVYAVKKDTFSNIWLGTFGKGLIKFNLKNRDFKVYNNNLKSKNKITNNLVRNIVVTKQGDIWFGTQSGLNRITQAGEIETYFYDDKLDYGDDILSVFQDNQGVIWAGVKAKGLFKLQNNTFKQVNLYVNKTKVVNVHSVLQDTSRYLWLSTNQGLIKYHIKSGQVLTYSQKDGLVSNEFNNGSALKINDSEFYFGGPLGVTTFNSKKINSNFYTPQVILTQLSVKNKLVDVKKSNKVLEQTLPYTKAVILNYNQGNFSLSFSIPSFINSKNNTYKYRLKGVDEKWNFTHLNTASYTIQKPGDYVFEVVGANGDGVWNTKATTLNIKVKPAPWRSWWAFLLYGVIIFSLFYFLLYILKQQGKLKQKLHIEHLETQKTKEINKAKLEFFTNISHEFRTPLTLIIGSLNQVLSAYNGPSSIYKKLRVVEGSSNHLLNLINRLMDFRKFENSHYQLQASKGNIVQFLNQIYLSFVEFAKEGSYQYNFISEQEEIMLYFDGYKLERVFYNLISNAFRYTPEGGKIEIKLQQQENSVLIEVSDSGIGIQEEYKSKIFDRFFEINPNTTHNKQYNKGTGIGLSIVRRIVDLHKGKVDVVSAGENKGTSFLVKLLLGKSHFNNNQIIKNFKYNEGLSSYTQQQLNLKKHTQESDIKLPKDKEKKTLLLVEDNIDLRVFIKGILIEDYNVIEAQNGKTAFRIAKNEAIDLIVSDVLMPVMTGIELCSMVKKELKTSHIPLILLTARTATIHKLEGLESGADAYISKPFNVDEFLLRIKNLLRNTERLKERFQNSDTFPNKIAITSLDEALYAKAIQIAKQNISNQDFDVSYFATELGVSRTMLFTKIKAWSSFTPNEFILHFRMTLAADLLEQGKFNIADVSYRVGFKDPKYFSKCFMKKYGETPKKYISKFLV